MGLDGVGVVLLHQIDKLRTEVSDGSTLVGHILYGHIRHHRYLLVLILQDVIVAIELSSDFRQIGHNGGDLSQVDAVARECQVLQHRRVLVLRIEFQTGLVVGDEVDLRLDLLIAAQEDIIILVQVEFLITHRWSVGHQFEADTA